MKKKLLVISILVVLLIGILPLTAYCQSEEEEPTPTEVLEETPTPDIGPTPTPGTTPTPSTSTSPTPKPSGTPTSEPSISPEEQTDGPTPKRTKRPTSASDVAEAGNLMLVAEVALGTALVGGGGAVAFFVLKKRRGGGSEKSLRKMTCSQYQAWVLRKLSGKSASSSDAAFGIDGFNSLGHPLAIKQSDSVGMNEIDHFAASIAKNKAKNGVIVAFGFSDDAIRGKVRARRNYALDIEMLTVSELISRRR